MPIIFAIAIGLLVLFSLLGFTISAISSQCLFAIRGTTATDMFKKSVAATPPSRFFPTFAKDGGPLDTRVWLAPRGADYLPEAVQRKARLIGRLYEIGKLIFLLCFLTMIAGSVIRYRF